MSKITNDCLTWSGTGCLMLHNHMTTVGVRGLKIIKLWWVNCMTGYYHVTWAIPLHAMFFAVVGLCLLSCSVLPRMYWAFGVEPRPALSRLGWPWPPGLDHGRGWAGRVLVLLWTGLEMASFS